MAGRIEPPQVGQIFVLPESEYRFGVGVIVARVTAVHERGEYAAEPWWRITATVANGTLQRHGGWVERELWIREASLRETQKPADVPPAMPAPLNLTEATVLADAVVAQDLVRELRAHGDAEVTVAIAGTLLDICQVTYDLRREKVVLHPQPDDLDEVLRKLFGRGFTTEPAANKPDNQGR